MCYHFQNLSSFSFNENPRKMSQAWNDILKTVEKKMRADRFETSANCDPRSRKGMVTTFPVRELTLRSLEEQTSAMKSLSYKYRLTIDPWHQFGVDLEAMVSLEIWQELQRIHRHVATIGELHNMLLMWEDVVVELAVLALHGGQEALKDHPAFLKINAKRIAVTSAAFPVNLLRVMGREDVEGPTLHQRFLYYTLATREVVGDLSVDQFVAQYNGTDINALLRYYASGNTDSWVRRPSIEQAGFNNIVLRGASRNIFDDSPIATACGGEERRRKRTSEEGEQPRGEASRGEASKAKSPIIKRLFEETEARGNAEDDVDVESVATNNNATDEERERKKVEEKARFLLRGGWDWSLFSPAEYHIAIPMARRRGIFSNPPDLMENLDHIHHVVVDARGNVLSVDGQSQGQGLVGLVDNDESMRTVDSSNSDPVSPRAELSLNTCATAEEQLLLDNPEATVDLTGSSEESLSTLTFSPFLAKPPKVVVNVSSSSEEKGDADVALDPKPDNDARGLTEQEEEMTQEEEKDDSVICDGAPGEEDEERMVFPRSSGQ